MAKYIYGGIDYTNEFDPTYYANKYADLKAAFNYDIEKLLRHWIVFGKKEKRTAKGVPAPTTIYYLRGADYSAEFDPDYYANSYADLKAAFGYDVIRLLDHWIVFGKKEGRKAKATPSPTPTARTWKDAVKAAFSALYDRDRYTYFYGAKGQVLTEQMMNYFWNAEPGHFGKYTAAEKEQIYKNSLGKLGYDCSGFTGWICTGDKRYSTGQVQNAKRDDLNSPLAGDLLYTTFNGAGRHIGLYVGNGFCAHMGAESTDAAIKEKRAGIRFEPIDIIGWEGAYSSNVLDYTGSYR